MQAEEFYWTSQDGVRIFARDWAVDNPRAVIALVHGHGEHIGRYQHVAAFFNRHQIAVTGNDHHGHGKSGNKRGHVRSWEILVDEVAELLVETEVRYPETPIFLYGHSMGGNLVLYYSFRRHPNISGLIASAPWIRLSFQPSPVIIALGKIMKAIYPAFSQHTRLDPRHISHDPQVVEAYRNDPLVHDQLTSGMGVGVLNAAKWLDQYRGESSIPLLIMHGSNDRITSSEASESFAKRQSGDVTFKQWKGLFHEIHNEPEKNKVFQYTLDWINVRLKSLY